MALARYERYDISTLGSRSQERHTFASEAILEGRDEVQQSLAFALLVAGIEEKSKSHMGASCFASQLHMRRNIISAYTLASAFYVTCGHGFRVAFIADTGIGNDRPSDAWTDYLGNLRQPSYTVDGVECKSKSAGGSWLAGANGEQDALSSNVYICSSLQSGWLGECWCWNGSL